MRHSLTINLTPGMSHTVRTKPPTPAFPWPVQVRCTILDAWGWCTGTTQRDSFSLFTHLSSHTLINPTNINWGLGFPCGSVVKNPPAMQGTWVGSLGWERSPGVGNGNPLQYSCLENPMDRGPWRATVCGVAKSQTRLSDFTHSTHTIFAKEARIYNGKKTISLISDVGKTR